MKTKFLAGAVLLPIALLAQAARAAEQINFTSTPGSINYISAGAPSLLGSGCVFELGAFAPGFDPSPANTAEWVANWTPLGRASYNPISRWYTGRAFLESNVVPFVVGGQAYVWGHDTSGEWILMSNPAWTWPFVSGGLGTPGGTTFSVSAVGTTAKLGSVNGSGYQMMTASASGEIPGVDPDQWLVQYFSPAELVDQTVSGWGADPDGDGATNLEELAAGTDPDDPSSARLVELEIVIDNGQGYVQARLPRVGRALVDHVIATSDDLADWDMSGAGVDVIADNSTELVLRSTNPAGTEPRMFYRFVISEP